MSTNKISLIIKREYTQRVRRKSFIITTILFPILMIGLMALPTIIAAVSNPETKHVAVVDKSGIIATQLQSDQSVAFDISDESVDKLRQSDNLDAILVVPDNALSTSAGFTLLTNNSLGLQSESQIKSILNSTVQQLRLAQHDDIPQLGKIMTEVQSPILVESLKIDGDEDEASSSLGSYLIGLLMSFILYMFVLIYGQMIMTSIIEEKNNRVLEIVVSSVKPTQIMLGKIFGIAGVAITQILIWGAIIGLFSTFVMPSLITNALTGNTDMELTSILTTIGNPGYILGLFCQLAILLILGYLFYSAIFAAIGSAVDNIQDASQLQSIATVPIILAMVFTMTVLNDPNSTLATWLTLIPFTAPMVTMARVPVGIPVWELIAAIASMILWTALIIWLAARIYRVGIFMYGKKPTIKDLISWSKYK